MTETQIRQASLADLDALRALEQKIIEAERPFDPDIRPANVIYYDLETLLSAQESTVLVIEDDGAIVGCGYIRIESALEYLTHDQRGYIGFIYVEAAYRGQGLAQEIIETLMAWGGQQGIEVFQLQVYSANEPAIRAYEKMGFTAVNQLMSLKRPISNS